jgi:DNA-directed RNA polymerase specialized sigma24 family protein
MHHYLSEDAFALAKSGDTAPLLDELTKALRRYTRRPTFRVADREDLIQEGLLAALAILNRAETPAYLWVAAKHGVLRAAPSYGHFGPTVPESVARRTIRSLQATDSFEEAEGKADLSGNRFRSAYDALHGTKHLDAEAYDLAEPDDEPDSALPDRRAVRDALQRLPREEACALRYFYGIGPGPTACDHRHDCTAPHPSTRSVAAHLGVCERTAQRRRRRGLAHVRKVLESRKEKTQ